MKTIEAIKKRIREDQQIYKDQYKVKELKIFGSYVKSKHTETSDLDILVEFEQPVSLLHMVSLENYLSDTLKVKVDLVPRDSLREELKEQILNESIPV
jgi:uncharacterized protein